MKKVNLKKTGFLVILSFLYLSVFPCLSRAQEVIAEINLGAHPGSENYAVPFDVTVDSVQNKIYVSFSYRPYFSEGHVAVIDGDSNTITTTIEVGAVPNAVEYNPINHKIYVANQNGGGVSVIDPSTNTVIKTINPHLRAGGVAIDPNTNKIYVTQEMSYYLWVIDGASDTQIGTYNLGVYRPSKMVFNPNSNRLYINNSPPHQNLIVFDTISNVVVKTIPIMPGDLAIDLVNNRLYCIDQNQPIIHVFDLDTETSIHSIPINSSWPMNVFYNPNTNKIFVSKCPGETVDVFDASSYELIKTLVGGNIGMAMNLVTNRIYVLERGKHCSPVDRPGKVYVVQDESEVTIPEAIEELIVLVEEMNLQQGIDNSLDAKLDAAFKALDDVNENNNVAAINALDAFINAVEAQRGKKISEAEADILIAAALDIIAMLNE